MALHRFNKVNTVRLSFGKLSCIEAKSLQFAFEVQSRGTRAQGAVLEFDIFPRCHPLASPGKGTSKSRTLIPEYVRTAEGKR